MGTVVIGYNNRVDAATLTGGNWTTDLPRANLQNRLISKVARTSGDAIADATINVDLGASYAIGVYALVGHNISVAGKVRIRADNAGTFASPLYDSGWVDVWAAGVVPDWALEFEGDNFFFGTLSSSERAGFQAPFTLINSAKTVARYYRIEVDDTTNASTYIQIGRLFMSNYWQPSINYQYGARLNYEDASAAQASLGGQEFFDQAPRYRVMRLTLDSIPEAEAYGQALETQRLEGTTGEILIIPDPADATNGIRRNFLGRARNLPALTIEPTGTYTMDLEIREAL